MGTAHALITTATAWYAPHGGIYQASLCGLNGTYYNSQTDVVKQTVTIPSGATQAALTFWAAVATKETGTVARDFLYVEIVTTSGTVLGTPVVLSNLHAGPWQAWTADLLAYKGQTVQIRFRGVTNATYGTVFLLDDTSLAVTVPLRREGGEGAARTAAAAGPEGALRVQGGGGRVAEAMDGKADSAMDVEAREAAEARALFSGPKPSPAEACAAEVNGTFVAWGGRPALASGPASPGPNAREVGLEEAESPEDTQGSFENEARVVCQGSEARVDKVQPETDEATSTSESADTLEEWATSAPAASSNAGVRYYVTDHLGSPRVVLDAQRQVLDRHDYEPFGVELTPFTDQADLTHRFTGHERDLATGYDYMHYRFYGSTLGRFLKPDSLVANAADPQSWNLYAYVRNNPANATDPTGHLSDLFLREIAASPSSDQGIGATRTADGTPPPAGQKEAEDLNEKNSGFWARLWDSVKLGFEALWDKVLGTPSDNGSDRSHQIEELEEEGIVNAGEAGQTNIGTKANAELRDAAATCATEVAKQVVILAATEGVGKVAGGTFKLIKGVHTTDARQAMKAFGLSKQEFNQVIHEAKNYVEGNPNMAFDLKTGDIIDQRSG